MKRTYWQFLWPRFCCGRHLLKRKPGPRPVHKPKRRQARRQQSASLGWRFGLNFAAAQSNGSSAQSRRHCDQRGVELLSRFKKAKQATKWTAHTTEAIKSSGKNRRSKEASLLDTSLARPLAER